MSCWRHAALIGVVAVVVVFHFFLILLLFCSLLQLVAGYGKSRDYLRY
jgi:hypothetical protein